MKIKLVTYISEVQLPNKILGNAVYILDIDQLPPIGAIITLKMDGSEFTVEHLSYNQGSREWIAWNSYKIPRESLEELVKDYTSTGWKWEQLYRE